jgi:hypothetical protein
MHLKRTQQTIYGLSHEDEDVDNYECKITARQ